MTTLSTGFDSLDEGTQFTTAGRTLAEADLVWFAGMTGDRHPLHTDAEWARESRFGQRVAHGMLLISYAIGLVQFDPERVVALRRISDVTFKHPAHIGDTIRVQGELVSKRALDDGHGLVGWRWRIRNQRDRLLAQATVEVVWRREPPVPGETAGATPEPVLL